MTEGNNYASQKYDVIVIGGGLSGLTAASLLSKRGLKVAVVDKSYNPGGSCGIFKRNNITFEQGASMLFGFGDKGFNSHRFVMNCLEEPIDIIKHDALYCVNYMSTRIIFWADIQRFADELAGLFPSEKENISRFYRDLGILYQHVMVDNPSFSTPDEVDPKVGSRQFRSHPVSYIKFLRLLNRSAESLLSEYFKDPGIFKFFDKLTSTYCYTTVKETPAILAAVMFVDNHVGGSYYPAGSTVFLPGRLEKVIEENNGDMLLEKEVVQILFEKEKPAGVALLSGEKIYADNLIYSGDVWSLSDSLIDPKYLSKKQIERTRRIVPTYPSVVLYAYIDKAVIPEGTLPIEMLVGNPDRIDESEVTVYIFSIDDSSLCPPDGHVVTAIGPSFENWDMSDAEGYKALKEREKERLIQVLEKRFPGFRNAVRYSELASPKTLRRYANKYGGSVAGPKQMIGQHMFKRLHTKSDWDTLYYCGESTVMGTGTPTVTVSGLSAANAVLKKKGLPVFEYNDKMKNYVNIVGRNCGPEVLNASFPQEVRTVMSKASRCQYCQDPGCMTNTSLDIRGLMRRVTVGNIKGAGKIVGAFYARETDHQKSLAESEDTCVMEAISGSPVEIRDIVGFVKEYSQTPRNQTPHNQTP